MVVGAVVVIGLLDNILANVQNIAARAVTDRYSKIIFKMKEMQQISGKINTNIIQSRSGKFLKLVAKMPKKYKIFLDIQ